MGKRKKDNPTLIWRDELFQCCIETIRNTEARNIEGRRIACPSCKSQLTFRKKAWGWFDEEMINGN